eukprot:CAMPEP_0185594960 /NCGR_PEP_ID=MMETSP0434-20130131/76752_1 /TAXON_ID=626734 ORGANISM="Favella taraikaensis, Strain Fe Narragansett Bay" /NCGR_SAMPLE_ID=MMETSP0434 /ASSEMBLY_ACC=CAM_ASM_000379 /LENGTH=74 /DNA_ID=CAMNT_0028222633 /DNA_START=1287 /DNA_END=1511 /DNA_ORIENTATION=+
MNVYDETRAGILDGRAAKRFISDALRDLDSQLSVSDAELDVLLSRLDSSGVGMLSLHDITSFFELIATDSPANF